MVKIELNEYQRIVTYYRAIAQALISDIPPDYQELKNQTNACKQLIKGIR